jgi:hypothetical protein
MSARRALPTAVAVLAALGIAACGSSKKTSSTTTGTVAAASTTSTTSTTSSGSANKKSKHKSTKKSSSPAKKTTKHNSGTHTTATHTTTTTTSHTTTTHSTPSAPTYTKPIHATLVGANHHPKAGKLWPFTVTADDANGHPLPGTVDINFTFQGQVVGSDTPKTHRLSNGTWHEKLTYPPAAVGHPIALQVVIHTPIGTVTLSWPVVVRG